MHIAMELEIFDEPNPFRGDQRYLQVGIYDGVVPICTTENVSRDAVAMVEGSYVKPLIAINDKVYEILNREHVAIICKRGIEHGFESVGEIPRSPDELEVLEFLREYGIKSELDGVAGAGSSL
jgi:hypothetical protein